MIIFMINWHNNKTSSAGASEYSQYKGHPRQFQLVLSGQCPAPVNPLYSQQSLRRYFEQGKPRGYTEPSFELYGARRKLDSGGRQREKIEKFDKLQALIRSSMQTFNSKKVLKRIDLVDEYVDKSEEHFRALNLDEGIHPLNEFSRENFVIQRYVQQLQEPKVRGRKTMRQMIREGHEKAHAENIVDYLHQEELESRYRALPTSMRKAYNDKTILVDKCERSNKKLRSKTEYCRRNYQPPRLKPESMDQDILGESRLYMKKQRQGQGRRGPSGNS